MKKSMTLKEITEMPTCLGNSHESVLRSFHILDLVLEMVERGDSKETIQETAEYLRMHHGKKEIPARNHLEN